MVFDEEVLSAFLDGELAPEQMQAVEDALVDNPELQAALEVLVFADSMAQSEFADLAAEPVPLALAAAIRAAPEPTDIVAAPPVSRRSSGWMIAAAVAGALVIGSGVGFFWGQNTASTQIAANGGWLGDIAEYHVVYASQVRHLVEVPAEEADHIEAWLSATLGATVTVPDLSDQGLSFEGARLLVASGRPVAQLVYTDAEGRVVALCQIGSDTPQDSFASRSIDGVEMISWGGVDANFVVVTDVPQFDLDAVARAAASQV